MQLRTRYALFIIALTLLVFALRLSVSYANGSPSYESYFTLLQADEIRETGTPRFSDPYSYQGRRYVFNPIFYYFVAIISSFLPLAVVMKVLPNLCMALLVPLAYLIGHRMTNARAPSLFAALFAGLSPVLFSSYLNTAHPVSAALPLLAVALYGLLSVEQQPKRALAAFVLFTLLTPLAWLVVIALLFYSLILLAERMKVHAAYYETALVSALLAFWWTLVVYKRALTVHGFETLTGNLPAAARAASFSEFTLVAMLVAVGAVPMALGLYALYHALYETRSRHVFLVAALGLATLVAAFLQLVELRIALLVLSVVFALLSAYGLHQFSLWIRKTRFEGLRRPFTVVVALAFILTSVLPGIVAGVQPLNGPSENELEAMQWLSEQEGVVVLAAPKAGFLINAVAQQPYVADESYLLIPNPDMVLEDIDTIYTTPFSVSAVDLLTKYGVTHIVLGPLENARYPSIGALTADPDCFPLLYKGSVTLIYGNTCNVEAQR